jgi:enoyl-CoA hydratase/carnithine racemase
MAYGALRIEENEGITVIELRGPMDTFARISQLGAELKEGCRRFRENAGQRVLVLTGDLPQAATLPDAPDDLARVGPDAFSLAGSLAAVERPVLAAITGDAIGIGLEMVLACDIRIASDQARFGLPHVKRGAIPWDGGTQRLLRTVGRAKTLEMVLIGATLDAQEAYRIGLVSRLAPAAEVLPAVMTMAHDMAAKSPVSMEYCKEAVVKGSDLTLAQGLRLEADLYYLMHTTRDRSEGIRAFHEKRKPGFEGI